MQCDPEYFLLPLWVDRLKKDVSVLIFTAKFLPTMYVGTKVGNVFRRACSSVHGGDGGLSGQGTIPPITRADLAGEEKDGVGHLVWLPTPGYLPLLGLV